MTVNQFYFRWWTDDDDHPWVRHECLDGKVDEWRCPPPWKVVEHPSGDRLDPSFHCVRCGRHTFLYASERIAGPVPAQEAEPA
ncbi:MAG TPA: hypothetical protein VJQ57_09490 [Acidimicrobiia bacterium]|nr:hypothetical protein [Acidimicrobiia bacterium]